MLITRTSSPTFAIVDPATLAEWLRIDVETDTATVAMLLASATDYIQGQTGRVLAAASYTVAFDNLAPCLPICLSPINSITSVMAIAPDGTSTALTAGTDYLTNAASAAPTIVILNAPTGSVGLSMTVNAGYTSPDMVPASIQHAAAVLVAAGYDSRSMLDPKTALTVTNLIAQYRRVLVG